MAEEPPPSVSWREKSALRAFDEQAVLLFHDLPRGVGYKTMRSLLAKGLIELVEPNIGAFAKDRRWRRTKSEK
ncbi:MAG: hypothetical protein ABSD74_17130 [Rhizomicrobium sp.]|jgi:hypothetical protein